MTARGRACSLNQMGTVLGVCKGSFVSSLEGGCHPLHPAPYVVRT
jgi:hypothetical protein